MQMAVRAMLMRSVAAAVLLLQAGQGLAQVPADTNDLDSIQRALDQAKAAQAAAARKKAASAAANRKQRQAQPAAPPDMDLATERQRMAPSYKAIGLSVRAMLTKAIATTPGWRSLQVRGSASLFRRIRPANCRRHRALMSPLQENPAWASVRSTAPNA